MGALVGLCIEADARPDLRSHAAMFRGIGDMLSTATHVNGNLILIMTASAGAAHARAAFIGTILEATIQARGGPA